MPELPSIFVAALTGFISGLILCIPVGPVNLTILNEGARRGFKWAALIGIGATVMEVIYCALAFTGFSSLIDKHRYLKAGMEVFSFLFMVFLGVKFMMAKTVNVPLNVGKTAEKLTERIEEKLHPHSAFFIGLVRTMANPGVLLVWILLAVYFLSRDWVQPEWQSKVACVSGVARQHGTVVYRLELGRLLGSWPVQPQNPAAHGAWFRRGPVDTRPGSWFSSRLASGQEQNVRTR